MKTERIHQYPVTFRCIKVCKVFCVYIRGVEAEAVEAANFRGSGKRIPLPFKPFMSNVKNLNVVQVFVKYTTKSECFIDHHLQRNIFKGLWFTQIRGSPHPYQLEDEPCSKPSHF